MNESVSQCQQIKKIQISQWEIYHKDEVKSLHDLRENKKKGTGEKRVRKRTFVFDKKHIHLHQTSL